MNVAVIADTPGVSQAQYEQVSRDLGEPKQWGVISHIAGPIEGGWRVVEVWESKEALQRFFQNERVQQAFQQAGIPPVHPVVFPVYRMVSAEVQANAFAVAAQEGSLQKGRGQ